MANNPHKVRSQSSFLLIVLVLFSIHPVQSQGNYTQLLQTVKTAPGKYFTPEAYSFYSRSGQAIPPQPPRETVAKAYKGAIALADMKAEANNIVPELIEVFPSAIHVTEIRNAQYSGEGTFEDWLMTYLTSERNKLILSSPVLDFNAMTLCESFIEYTHQVDFIDKKSNSTGTVINATVNISITFTLHIGACVLTKITGEDIGNEQQNWRNWYKKNNSDFSSSEPATQPTTNEKVPTVRPLFKDILVKGTYRMVLTTGTELTGIVEFKSDTSLILETSEGKPYTFRYTLIQNYELLQPPKILPASTGANTNVQLTFDELQHLGVKDMLLEITTVGGTSFTGTLASIDESMLKVDIDGSKIPITREAIRGITRISPKTDSIPNTSSQSAKIGPQDTLIVKNPQVDDWGKAKPDFVYTGVIQNQNDNFITIITSDGVTKSFKRSEIVRIIRNTKNNSDEPIKRYAKPLFCPNDMFLVDMPPGKQEKPFFKVCVDRYEFPNKNEVIPTVSVSFIEAKNHCESQGKRLCTSDEWQWACSGLEGYPYPYGWNRDDSNCNVNGANRIEASGSRHNCVSKYGGYDMTGNVFEWVTGSESEPALMGGPYSKCQTVSPGLDGSAKPQIGLRCCKSN